MAEIEAGQALVNANRELITRFESQIQSTLARIWGDIDPPGLAPGVKKVEGEMAGVIIALHPIAAKG